MNYFEGLSIYRFNHAPNSQQHVDARLNNYVISYVHTGRIYWRVNHEAKRVLKAPLVFFTWPGERWRYGPVDTHWNNRFISFSGPRTQAMLNGRLFPRCKPKDSPRPIHDPDTFCQAFDHMLRLLEMEDSNSPQVVHAVEGLFLNYHLQPRHPLPSSGPAERVRLLNQAVNASPDQAWDFNTEAQRVGCTPTHFRRLWKRQTGKSPIQSLQMARMRLAASLLRKGELSVEQVAHKCGFEHLSYFYRLYVSTYNLTPGEFREQAHTVA